MKESSRLTAITVFIFVMSIAIPAMSATIVDIDIVEAGTSTSVSEMTIDVDYEFRMWIENDVQINGMQLGFRVWSDNGADWVWRDVGGVGTLGCVTMVPGCRMDGAFDLLPLGVIEQDMDEISPDTFIVWGVSMMNYLDVGPSEHMVSFHFTPTATGTICIDSTYVPPAYYFIFTQLYGGNIYPDVGWSQGGKCWEVKEPYVCGDTNNDEIVNILDITRLISYLYKDGPPPECPWTTKDSLPADK